MIHRFPLMLFFSLLVAAAPAAPILLEAEANPQGPVKQDDACTGGSYVAGGNAAWSPVFNAELPKELPEKVKIWVHRRGGAVQLKAVVAGAQQDRAWDYGDVKDFAWRSLGEYDRGQLGESIMLIRGDGGPDVEIDSVVMSGDAGLDLEALLPPLPLVALTVDATKPGRTVTRDHFGLNGFAAFDPSVSANPKYTANLAYMNPGLFRIHNSGMLDDGAQNPGGWVDAKKKTWLKARVLAALAPLRNLNSRIVLNINTWPSWMDANGDGRLDPDQHAAYAAFCADLVRIVNAPGAGKPILWWEITNEMDDRYHKSFFESKKPDLLNELTDIYLKTAKAMRAADPKIKTGAPSSTNSYNMDFHKRFIAATAPQLDFYSMHLYITGSRDTADAEVFKAADGPAWPLSAVGGMLKEISPGRKIELWMDEYNINWDWQARDTRMNDWRGAVWDAAFCVTCINAGADATAAWNECDGAYGKTSSDHERRPAAESFHFINALLPGKQLPASLAAPKEAGLQVLAVQRVGGKQALLLLNIGSRNRTIQGVSGKVTLISSTGTSLMNVTGQLTLPSISLALVEL
jgi:Glycosyl hydrolases family 39